MRILLAFLLTLSVSVAKEVSTSVAVLETNLGSIEITLRPDVAPKTVENFVGLIKKGYYDGLIFHRVIKNFMIQGGDPTGTGRGGESLWGKAFNDEFSTKVNFDKPGVLAMANSGRNTNGSQFFITTVATPWLNGRHSIFGFVTKGMDIVKKIENAPTSGRRAGDKPLQTIYIKKASLK